MEVDILDFVQECRQLAKQALGKHAGEPASGGFARWKHVVIHCFRREEGYSFRETENRLEYRTELLEVLDLEKDDVPDFTTLNKSFDRFSMCSVTPNGDMIRRLVRRSSAFRRTTCNRRRR